MKLSDESSKWNALMTNFFATSDSILNQDGLHGEIRKSIVAANSICRIGDTFETNKEDIVYTSLLVAQVIECIIQNIPTATWQDKDLSDLATRLETLKSYLEGKDYELSDQKLYKMDENSQVDFARKIQDALKDHNEHIRKAASVLQLKLPMTKAIEIDDSPTQKTIKLLRGSSSLDDQSNWHLANYSSKLDAVLDFAVQVQRTIEYFQHQVAIRNRTPRDEIAQSLEELQRMVDQKALSQWNSSKPLDLKKHVAKWMLSSKMVEFDRGAMISHSPVADLYQGTYLGRKVTVKLLHGTLNTDSQDLERDVEREIKHWSQVSKLPYVQNLIGVCTKVSKILVVSEWCPHTIISYLDERPTRLLAVVYELICGLASIHEFGVIHGDLRCSNVLVTDDNHVAISDFGFSRSAAMNLTQYSGQEPSGDMINWSSPEMVFRGRKVGSATDIWSFAMTVYHLLSKEIPFNGRTKFEIESALRTDNERPARPPKLNPALDPLWNQLEKCWLKDPSERPTARVLQKFMENTYNANREPTASANLLIQVSAAKQLPKTQILGKQNPYVEIVFNGQTYRTPTDDNGHVTPKWSSLLEVKSPSNLDMNQVVHIKVMNEKLIGRSELATSSSTIGQLFEACQNNRTKINESEKKWFKLNPKGQILIEAYRAQEQSAPKPNIRVFMERICAVEGEEDTAINDTASELVKCTVCVVGPGGAGKSTLINSIFGERKCDTGLWGGCTKELTTIGKALELTLVDTPSFPFDGHYVILRRAFQRCRVAVVVFQESVSEVGDVARMALAEGCNVIFVRNKRQLLPLVCEVESSPLSTHLAYTEKKDRADIEQIKRNAGYFYIDARAVLRARLPDGKRISKEYVDAWIELMVAVWKSMGVQEGDVNAKADNLRRTIPATS
ncbi:hypothetical protein AeRB84_012103 [Aphanomyces euteiches]|nr:hypothetical protein AeRB84_012103 [Aphanomyces euteiches]